MLFQIVFLLACSDDGRYESIPNQFTQSFEHGKMVGKLGNLQFAIQESKQYEREQLHNYWDGVSHEFQWANHLTTSEIMHMIDEHLSYEIHPMFYDGLVIQMVQKNHGEMISTVEKAKEFSEQYNISVYNGLRVGFWREYKNDLYHGIEIANQYPKEYYGPLIEELGWWIGYQTSLTPLEEYDFWKTKIHEEQQCMLLRGILRGWMMIELEQGKNGIDVSKPFIAMESCEKMAWLGLQVGIQTLFGSSSQEYKEWIKWVRTEHPHIFVLLRESSKRKYIWDSTEVSR